MTTGEKIRAARKAVGLTQKQLGELCNIAESTIRRYELGKLRPKNDTLSKIAPKLGKSIYDLMDDSYIAPNPFADRDNGYSPSEQEQIELERKIDFMKSQRNGLLAQIDTISKELGEQQQNELLSAFNKLNYKGKAIAIKRVEEVVSLKEYCCESDEINKAGD